MTGRVRKFALTAHVVSSVGWLGSIAGVLALAITGSSSDDVETVQAAYLAMEVTAWVVLVPLALASLLTGLVQSLGTKWGLFRHYWGPDEVRHHRRFDPRLADVHADAEVARRHRGRNELVP
jgi:hypothetical protein